MMWVTAKYESTSLFTLKPATATASGGRTLPVPTPFAIKMALLDVVCRVEGVGVAETVWEWLNTCHVALRPAAKLVINNTVIKYQREWQFKGKKDEYEAAVEKARQTQKYPFQPTIAYREYVYLDGDFGISLEVSTVEQAIAVGKWLTFINYLGKRGGFIQIQDVPQNNAELDHRFIVVGTELQTFELNALLLQLDDTSPELTFEKANIYSDKNIQLGKERVLRHVALPYHLVRSSQGYSYYALKNMDETDDSFL